MNQFPIRTKRGENNGTHWEKVITKYVVGAGVHGFRWDEVHKRFLGLKGMRFARVSVSAKLGWKLIPQEFKKYEEERKNPGEQGDLVLFVVNKRNMPYVRDVWVLQKLDTYAKTLAEAVAANGERYYGGKE
jgi:hypothetical protein